MNMNEFLSAEPFPHIVIDGFLPERIATMAAAEFNTVSEQKWHRYDGHDERSKAAFNELGEMPETCRSILEALTHDTAAAVCAGVTGIEGLTPDQELYGGGLHSTGCDGFLGVHIDNERHPRTGFARRLNLIVYCTEGWREEWGGHLEFWDRRRTYAVAKIAPLFNRAVLFETCAYSYHGHPEPLRCPPDVRRNSIAVYYWSEPRARARFLGTANEPFSYDREAARIARSGINLQIVNEHLPQGER